MKPPLKLSDQWLLLLGWMQSVPRLSASEQSVLFFLLQHQNTRDGRCYPSFGTLSGETGFCERQVRNAVAGLRNRGAITTWRPSRTAPYHYGFRSVIEVQSERHASSIGPAPQFSSERHQSAGKKEKKRINEKEDPVDDASGHTDRRVTPEEEKQFHDDIIEELKRVGRSKFDLMNVETKLLRNTLWESKLGKVSRQSAIQRIVEDCLTRPKANGELLC